MQTDRILFVVTSATRMGNSSKATGSWLEEIAAPYYVFKDARCAITLASPQGGEAPIDAESLQAENLTASTRRFEADSSAKAKLATTAKLSALNADDFDAIFFAGGHGTMEDFPNDASVKRLVETFYAAGKPLSAVCHGPACLVSAKKQNGEPLVKGHRFSCFTDEEETAVGLAPLVPFMLESTLVAQGGIAVTEKPFQPCLVADRNLITGQNPASAIPVAESVVHSLRAAKQHRRAA